MARQCDLVGFVFLTSDSEIKQWVIHMTRDPARARRPSVSRGCGWLRISEIILSSEVSIKFYPLNAFKFNTEVKSARDPQKVNYELVVSFLHL